jgi:hypothetical protein
MLAHSASPWQFIPPLYRRYTAALYPHTGLSLPQGLQHGLAPHLMHMEFCGYGAFQGIVGANGRRTNGRDKPMSYIAGIQNGRTKSAAGVSGNTAPIQGAAAGSTPSAALQTILVQPLPIVLARRLLVRHHYLHSLPGGTRLAFGVLVGNRLLGSITRFLMKGICPRSLWPAAYKSGTLFQKFHCIWHTAAPASRWPAPRTTRPQNASGAHG